MATNRKTFHQLPTVPMNISELSDFEQWEMKVSLR